MDLGIILGNIGFDWRIALANLVNFLIIFYLLKRFAWGPLKEVLETRRMRILQGLEDAERAATERMMAEEAFAARVADAKKERNDMIARAKIEENAIREHALKKADADAREVMRNATQKVSDERMSFEREMKRRSAELIIEGVEKVVREEFDDTAHDRLIRSLISA